MGITLVGVLPILVTPLLPSDTMRAMTPPPELHRLGQLAVFPRP